MSGGKKERQKNMTFSKSVFVFAFVVTALLTVTIGLGGPAHVAMLIAAIVAGIVAVSSGYSWDELQEGIGDTIKAAVPAILILLAIGVIIGVWLLGGIVPTMIYYGLKILSPSVFLLASCLICAVIATATGSSWSTVGTIGVALMGIGSGLGVPAGMTAGAIISGAYFGDKMSPLSDTTNLAPAMAGTDIFTHIRHMIYTTGPSFIIALILYGIIGIKFAGNNFDSSLVELYTSTLKDIFYVSPIMLIPPVLVIIMVIKKIPALPGLIAVAFLGCVFALVFQGADLQSVISSAFSGFSIETGVAEVDKLLNRGGMTSMMEIICLILISLSFAGIVEKSGMVNTVIERALKNDSHNGNPFIHNFHQFCHWRAVCGADYSGEDVQGYLQRKRTASKESVKGFGGYRNPVCALCSMGDRCRVSFRGPWGDNGDLCTVLFPESYQSHCVSDLCADGLDH